MATFTCSAALPGVQPKAGHVGVQCETFSIGTATGAAGDVILGCKIPTGATVLDCMIRLHSKADAQTSINVFLAKVGDGSATAIAQLGTQLLSATGGAVMFRPTILWTPTRISLSDDAAIQYAMLKLSFTAGTTTASFSANGYVSFTMDES